jgi:hypothetical protein
MARKMVVENADVSFARDTLRAFVDALALTRALQAVGDLPYPFLVAQGAAFDTAAIGWCVLFGSHDARQQPMHWKNMFDKDSFRAALLKALGLSLEDWTAYRRGLVDYRNEIAAHRDLDPATRHFPNFDLALEAAEVYHGHLRALAAGRGINMEGPGLTAEYEERLGVFTKAMAAGVAAAR